MQVSDFKTLIAIDFETADYKPDSACAIGMVRIEDMKIVDTFSSLIRPPRSKVHFTEIHGLTWNDVKDAPTFPEVWQQAQNFLQNADAYIAHNAPFDRKVLQACCIQGRHSIPTQPFFCTLKASRKFLKLPSHKLNVIAEHFNIALTHHEAFSDARAAGLIFINLHNLGHNLLESKCK